jgi:hypothetical protein
MDNLINRHHGDTEISAKISFDLFGVESYLDEHYNTMDIKNSLMELPDRIAIQKGIVRKFRDAFREADLPRQMLELEMIDDIAADINCETGKKAFSNDSLRAAELKRRKAKDEDYQELQVQAKEAERELSAAEDELERLNNRFTAYQHVSDFVAAEMNLMAGLMKVPGGVKVRPEVPEGTGTWKQPTGQPY